VFNREVFYAVIVDDGPKALKQKFYFFLKSKSKATATVVTVALLMIIFRKYIFSSF